jgi:FKBP12-rapamycin complex-associated protein
MSFVVPAIKGFFRSVSLSSNQTLQDALRILTLWFKYGATKEVEMVLQEGFQATSVDTWLQVLPQIIARIHTPLAPVKKMINELLTSIGRAHPQAVLYL